jgi:hypothetical protein
LIRCRRGRQECIDVKLVERILASEYLGEAVDYVVVTDSFEMRYRANPAESRSTDTTFW